MTQNLLELAKQGDPQAIASLMNRSLQPKGMTATVDLQGDTLWVWLEASQIPNRQVMTSFVQNGIQNLGVEHIHTVKVAGQQMGANSPAWTQEIHFETAAAIAPPSVAPAPEPEPPATIEPPSESVVSPLVDSYPDAIDSNGLGLDGLEMEMGSTSAGEQIDFSGLEATPGLGLDEENLGMDSTDLDFSGLTDDEPIPTINLLDDASDDLVLNLSDTDFPLEAEAPTPDLEVPTEEDWLSDLTAESINPSASPDLNFLGELGATEPPPHPDLDLLNEPQPLTEADSALDLSFLEESGTTTPSEEDADFSLGIESPSAAATQEWNLDLSELIPDQSETFAAPAIEEDWSLDLPTVPDSTVAATDESDWSFDLTEPPATPTEPQLPTDTEDWSFDLPEPPAPSEPVASTEEDWSLDLTEPSATAEPVVSTEEDWSLDLPESPLSAEPVASTEEDWAFDLPELPVLEVPSPSEEDWSLDLTELPATPTTPLLQTEEEDWSLDLTEPPTLDPLQAFEELETAAPDSPDPAFGAFEPSPTTEEDWAFDLDQPVAPEPSFTADLSFDLPESSTLMDFPASDEPDLSFDLPGSTGTNLDATTEDAAADDWSFDLPESSTVMDFPETTPQDEEFHLSETSAGVDAIATDEDWAFDLPESSTVIDFPEITSDEGAAPPEPSPAADALSMTDEEDWSFELPESPTVMEFPETTPQDEEFNPQEPMPLMESSLPADEEDWSFDLPEPPGFSESPVVATDLTSDEVDWSLDLPESSISETELPPEAIAPSDLPPDSEEDWALDLPDPSLLAHDENLAAAAFDAAVFDHDEDWSLDLQATTEVTSTTAHLLFDGASATSEEPSPLELAEFVPPTEENFSTDENLDTDENWAFELSDDLPEVAPPVVSINDEAVTDHLLDLSQLDLPSAAPIEAIADDLQPDEDLSPEAFALHDDPAQWESELLTGESDLPSPFMHSANGGSQWADLSEPAAVTDEVAPMAPEMPSTPVSPYEEDDLLFDQSGEPEDAVSNTESFAGSSFVDSDDEYTSEYMNGAVPMPTQDITEVPSEAPDEELQATDLRVYPEESNWEESPAAAAAATVAAKEPAPTAANRSGGMLFWIVLMVLVGWIGGLLTATFLRSRQPIPTPPPQTAPQSMMTSPAAPPHYVGPV